MAVGLKDETNVTRRHSRRVSSDVIGQRHAIKAMHRLQFVLLLVAIIAGCDGRHVQTVRNDVQSKPEDKQMADPKTECEEVMNAVLPFAEEMLTKHREFSPFGGTMSADGEIAHTGGWTGEEHPASTEVIELLEKGFRAGTQRGEYKATALVYDIRTIPPGKEEKQDAIAVALDHRDDYSVVVIFPYSFTSDGQLEIEAPFATRGENKIFSQ